MNTKPAVPAVPGWFTTDEAPTLLGARCRQCAAVAFPPNVAGCPNPACRGAEFEAVPLPRTGTIWSFTDARYQPPPPYVSPKEPYEPFGLAAVELDGEGMIVLGAVADGYGVCDLSVGQPVELVVEPLFEDDEQVHLMWRWRPVGRGQDA